MRRLSFKQLKVLGRHWYEKIAYLFPRELLTSTNIFIKTGRFVDLRYASLFAEGQNLIGENSTISGEIHLGYATTIGNRCSLFGKILIGRYCQLGPHVAIYAENHPFSNLTSYTNRRLFNGRLKEEYRHGVVYIGHDVWIGHGAVILPNVTIGTGAVIGAGAVVTRNVDEFTIVAGNPARLIHKRFDDKVITVIRQLKWWEYSPEEILHIEELFHIDINENQQQFINTANNYIKIRNS